MQSSQQRNYMHCDTQIYQVKCKWTLWNILKVRQLGHCSYRWIPRASCRVAVQDQVNRESRLISAPVQHQQCKV